MTRGDDMIRRHIVVDATADEAFRRFVDLAAWWPRALTFRGAHAESVTIEPREGGRVYERADDGDEVDWGEVRVWDPPRRVVFSWRVSAERTQEPPERASEVEVGFVEQEGPRTMVEVQHRNFDRHGDGERPMREGMAGEDGWQGLLEAYAEPFGTGGDAEGEESLR